MCLALPSFPFLRPCTDQVRGDDLTNLPWSDLSTSLSSPELLLDTSPADYVAQCVPEFQKDMIDRHHLNLLEAPSGLCTNSLSSGFQDATPTQNVSWAEWWAEWGHLTSLPQDNLPAWLDPKNPLYNIPSKVLFPANAGDASAAVGFAKQHNVEISIKNSGHHYMGASTKKDTLHMNMNKYKRYATINGPSECKNTTIEEVFINQPCNLALARGRQATLRIGGGENFNMAYDAVKAFNEDPQTSTKYHLVGGGSGTVSPMGWTWQGGLAGMTGGRKYGLGVDQVLQVEMILPNGLHVRFGPTAWEDSDYLLYPKITKVSGECNENPNEEDESLWEWKVCPDVDFDDLWFAVRGGGGGTWGVVLSVHVQLHDYLPMEIVTTPVGAVALRLLRGEVVPQVFQVAAWEFMIDFLWNPTALGLSDDDSNKCGSTLMSDFFCYGESSGANLLTAWKDFIIAKNTTLLSLGVSSALIDDSIAGSPNTMFADFPDQLLATFQAPEGTQGPHDDKAIGNEKPEITPTPQSSTFLLPKKCILENREYFLEFFALIGQTPVGLGSFYVAFGVDAEITNDQTTSVSDAYREAGVQFMHPLNYILPEFDFVYEDIMSMCYDTEDKDNFPPIFGSNHAGATLLGPMKSNWTKSCPAEWTLEQRESDCISIQEAIYGTKLLGRLEGIKNTIDPTYMFDCYKCVGNNRVDAMESSEPTEGTSSASSMQVFFHLILVGAFASIL